MQYDRYRVKKKKLSARSKLVMFFAVVAGIFAFFVIYIKYLVTPLVINTSSSQIKVYATKSMNYAITEAMNQSISYDDLVNIVTDSSGKISLIQANTVKINNISMMIERITLAHLLEISRSPIYIPLGAFTGLSILAGIGPKVEVEIYPYGEVGCKFLSQFISAGINQTQHKIYVSVETVVNVVLPFKTMSIKMNNDVLVCESIIIGQIPETYLKSNSLSEMVDLVPH